MKNIISGRTKQVEEQNKSAKELEKRIYLEKLEEKISSKLGRKAILSAKGRKKDAGKLEIEYYSTDDLEALLEIICGSDVFDE